MANKRGFILNYFKPSIYVRSFMNLNITQLKRQDIKLLICDLDNTLVPHFTKLPNKDVMAFFKKLEDAKIDVAIMSNNLSSRVKVFAEKAKVETWYGNAKKPFTKTTKKIIKKFNLPPSKVAIMGDQIIMDILVANRLKCESILVQPLISSDYKMNKFNLFLETKIYKNLERNNILKQGEFDYKNLGENRELL